MNSKPLLLLDVDGVLLHQHSEPGWKSCRHGWYNPKMVEALAELAEGYEIVWCTGWGHSALTEIAPLFGCAEFPVLPLSFPTHWVPRPHYVPGTSDDKWNKANNWKLSSVEEWLWRFDSYQPVAWLDDEIGQTDVKRWAQSRPNTLLVHVNAHKGIGKDDLKRLREFAHMHKPLLPFSAAQGFRDRLHVRPAE